MTDLTILTTSALIPTTPAQRRGALACESLTLVPRHACGHRYRQIKDRKNVLSGPVWFVLEKERQVGQTPCHRCGRNAR